MFAGHVEHRFSIASSIVPLDVPLGRQVTSSLHLAPVKSALGIPRVRAVADMILAEWAPIVR
jgi:hypothetical protein